MPTFAGSLSAGRSKPKSSGSWCDGRADTIRTSHAWVASKAPKRQPKKAPKRQPKLALIFAIPGIARVLAVHAWTDPGFELFVAAVVRAASGCEAADPRFVLAAC